MFHFSKDDPKLDETPMDSLKTSTSEATWTKLMPKF